MLFHVRRYETGFNLQLAVLDWDKLSSNDHIADATFSLEQLITGAPQKDEKTGLYPAEVDGTQNNMKEFELPLSTAKESLWESKHNPVLRIKFVLIFVG